MKKLKRDTSDTKQSLGKDIFKIFGKGFIYTADFAVRF